MRRVNFNDEKFQEVTVKGISCMFSDGRIDRDTVPDGLYLYEVAGDDDIGDEPSRVKEAVLINFIGTLITDIELPLGEDGVLWLDEMIMKGYGSSYNNWEGSGLYDCFLFLG